MLLRCTDFADMQKTAPMTLMQTDLPNGSELYILVLAACAHLLQQPSRLAASCWTSAQALPSAAAARQCTQCTQGLLLLFQMPPLLLLLQLLTPVTVPVPLCAKPD
jgi:hypothetical protein